MFVSLAGFYLNQALRSISTLVVCGSNKFFGEVFVLKSDKHTCFVMMSYRLCADGYISQIRVIRLATQPFQIIYER